MILIIAGSSLAGLALIYCLLAKRRAHLAKVKEIKTVKTKEKFAQRQQTAALEKELNAPEVNDRELMMQGLKEAEAIKDAQKLRAMAQVDGDGENLSNMVVSKDEEGGVLIAVQRKTDSGDQIISHIL